MGCARIRERGVTEDKEKCSVGGGRIDWFWRLIDDDADSEKEVVSSDPIHGALKTFIVGRV